MSGLLLCKMGRTIRGLITLLCMVFGLFMQAQTVIVGTGTGTQKFPLGSYYGFERSASLYTGAEIGASGSILSLAWKATGTLNITLPVKIYVKSVPSTTTTITAQNWSSTNAGSVLVYDGTASNITAGWYTVTLQTPYYYNSADNLMVLVETNFGGSGGGGGTTGAAITYSTATSKHMYYQKDNTAPTDTDLGLVTSSRPNIQITLGPGPACLPTGVLSLGTVTATNAVLNWTAPSPAPAEGYEIYYSTTNTPPTATATPSQTVATGSTATLSPLTPNVTYYVWVRAKCSGTSQSTWSGPISFVTPPTCPPMPTAGSLSMGTITQTSAVLNWTAFSYVPAQGYDVYYSTTNTPPTGATTPSLNIPSGTTATLSPLIPNTTYYAWVRARCSGTDQSTWSGPISFVALPTCPPMPTTGSLSMGTITQTGAVLNWTAFSYVPAQGYDVYYSTTNTPPTGATTPSLNIPSGTTATLSPLAPNTTYYAWVRARCSATDQSSWKGPISFYTGYCVPTGGISTSYYLNNVTTTGGISNINYTANSYSVYVNSATPVISAIPATSVTMNLATSGNGAYYYYIWVDWNKDFDFDDPGEKILNTSSGGYLGTATGVIPISATQAPGTYRVRAATSYIGALNPCGSSNFGNYVDFTLEVIALQPCNNAPPSNITVSNITASTAVVNWIPAIGATYTLQYRKVGTTVWEPAVNLTTPLTSSYTIINLADQTQYEVQIATKCNGTTGAFSPSVNFTTPALTHCTNVPPNTTSPGYISKVVVTPTNGPLMVSDSGYDVYKDYSADPTRLVTLVRGTTGNKISVTKFWPSSSSSFGIGVWIDLNRNGIFETSERMVTGASNTTATVTTAAAGFDIPLPPNPITYSGPLVTKMRVVMMDGTVSSACGPFATYNNGEVEDYAVKLIDQPVCSTTPITSIIVSNLTDVSATFSWIAAANATYQLRYRKVGTTAWTTINPVPAPGNIYPVDPAAPLTEQTLYEVQVATKCGTGAFGVFSASTQFTTLPIQYCQMVGSGDNDHIANVTVTSANLGVLPMSNNSVQTNYISYNTPATLITLDVNSQNNKISVGKGWTGSTGSDTVAAWIDFNRNGQFETNERILNAAASTTTPVTALFDVPATAYTGPLTTTMRVVLKRTSAPVMCQNAVNGEVEDYRVTIRPCSTATPNAPTFTRTHNSATITWTGAASNVSYVVRYRVQGTTTWTEVFASTLLGNMPLTINGLTPATTYEVEIAAICGTTVGTATLIDTFTTKCDPTPPTVSVSNITSTTALITWAPLAANSTYTLRWRKVGTTGWPNADILLPVAPANTYVLGSVIPLESYTTYEVQIANMCNGESTLNPYSNPKVFTTERICEIPPPGLTITQLLPTSAEVKWDPFPGATYVLRYRKVGIPSWTEVPTPVNNVVLNGLIELTKYEMQVVNICNGTPGNYTPPYYFTTPTVIYCKMGSGSATGEHISKVTVKPNGKPTMENASGASTYTDYTGVPKAFIELIQGSTDNEIIIEKKWTGNTYNEGIAVWIDFNRNGEFDINERVFTSSPNTTSPVSGKFDVPVDAFVSMTDYKYVVMRVAMERDGIPVSCANFKNGEVEDYTVRISKKAVSNPLNQTEIMIYPNPVSSVLFVKNISKKAQYKIYNAAGQVIADGILLNNQINVSRLINGVYVIDIDDNGNIAQKKFIKE